METSHGVRGSASRAARGGSGIEWTPANVVTMVRICLIPLFVVLMLAPWGTALFTAEVAANVQPWCALVLFVLISMTDGIDGYLARSRNEITVFGKFMDPIADKVLVMSALIVLVQLGSMPSWIPIVILTRELLVSGLRMLVASAGVVVAASWIGKAKTATTMVAICLFIVKGTPVLYPAQPWFSLVAWVAMIVAVVLTVVSIDRRLREVLAVAYGCAGRFSNGCFPGRRPGDAGRRRLLRTRASCRCLGTVPGCRAGDGGVLYGGACLVGADVGTRVVCLCCRRGGQLPGLGQGVGALRSCRDHRTRRGRVLPNG